MTGWGNSEGSSIVQVAEPEVKQAVAAAAATLAASPEHMESILMYGKPKVGKSFAACSVIEDALAKNPKTTIFYVCTDNGFDLSFQAYFKERSEDVMRHMVMYPAYAFKKNVTVPLFTQVAAMFSEIGQKAKKTDWLVVDLADNFYVWAQDEWLLQSSPQNSVTTYMSDAAKDLKKYVEYNRNQWGFIKRLDNIATNNILESQPCNLLYIFGEKLIEMGEDLPDEQQKEASDAFELVGCKPGGQKNLPYAFSTIVYISGLKQKKFIVLGDRGYFLPYEEVPFEKHWYQTFLTERKSQMK